ncbi:hypothetical protein [Actinophytocola xanthii]|uniref:Uncharacterized protein n=1 Tax=Actinophytocola xanthii TaxID=1912961 RepID=A0A1Q8CUR0_9PSEU|nr:hypothetical protein [Actinophytocola xanthii]OLF18090.1 hypothetical protein BU204_08075 [Actinophytocola xanthii]
MIVVLLLTVVLVLGGLGFGIYLLVRPDPPVQGVPAPRPPADEGPSPSPSASSSTPSTSSTTAPPASSTSAVPLPSTTEPETGGGETAGRAPGDPRDVARDYVRAVNARDEPAATDLTCARADAGTLFPLAGDREVALREVEVIEDTVASATVRVGDEETALLLENQENRWCVSI